MPTKPGKITEHERHLIDALRWLTHQGGWARAHEIAARTGQSPQGVATVVASALRKDLVNRRPGRGHMWYSLTRHGWQLARPREQARERLPLACGEQTEILLPAAAAARRAEGRAWCVVHEDHELVVREEVPA